VSNKEVQVGQFAEVLDGTLGTYGVKKGDIVYLAGDSLVRVDEDPYHFRKIFLAAFLKGKHIDLDVKPFTIDGKRLKPVSTAKQTRLDEVRLADFAKQETEIQIATGGF
jgi:hypothetical protein